MSWSWILPFYLGFAAVFQAGLNRHLSKGWGLSATTFLNSLVLAALGLLVWMATKSSPERMPEILRNPGGAFASFEWWYWIPGVLGFTLVMGIPLAISRIGALQTFVVLIGSQIVASMIWDALAEGRPVNAVRVIGAVLAFLAAALVNWKG